MRRFMPRRLLPVVAAATLLTLAACGGAGTDGGGAAGGGESDAAEAPENGGRGGGAGDGFDLCATLTLDEVSDAAGIEATDQTGVNLTQGQASCNYNGEDGLAIAGHTYTTTGSAIDPTQMFEGNLDIEGAEEIDGVGDRAVMVGSDDFPILWVIKGDSLYALSVLADNLDAAGKREATIELARIAVGRLP
ncbi:MAG: DUF3558 family protein [Chloroflexi bacterium]|nr:DUF3558 family protein [Chloroflexota bacterium]